MHQSNSFWRSNAHSAHPPEIDMPEERFPVKGAFLLVGFRVWTRVAATVSRRISI